MSQRAGARRFSRERSWSLRRPALLAVLCLFGAALLGPSVLAQSINPGPGSARGGPSTITPGPDGYLNRPGRRGGSYGYDPAPPEARLGSGSGFFINSTYLVTNAHVIEKCASMRDPSGRRLQLVDVDYQLDLALLRADRPSDRWLRVANRGALRLGSEIYVMGYPFYGDLGRSVIVTRGVISSRTGYRGDRKNFSLTAPMQPGNSGGPVLGMDGRVIGVAVARLVGEEYTRDPENFPQNINFAVGPAALHDFLEKSGVDLAEEDGLLEDLTTGVPVDYEESVAPVLCD